MLSLSPAQAARVLYKPSLSPDHRPIGSHPGRRFDQWKGRDRQTLVTISSSLRSSHLQQGSDISEHFLGWVRSRSVSRIWHQENIIITGSSVTRPWAGVVAKTPVTSDSCLLRRVINWVTEPWWADEKWTGNFGITDGWICGGETLERDQVKWRGEAFENIRKVNCQIVPESECQRV